jgi:hypothetical protein
MKRLLFIMLILLTFISCKKSDDVTPDTTSTTKELVANPTFDWKTSREITLNIVGMKDINPSIINTLYVKSSFGDTIYYQELLVMANNYILKFAVPSTETKVLLVYGSKMQTVELISNSITFDYIVE